MIKNKPKMLSSLLQATFEMIRFNLMRESRPLRTFNLLDISAAFRESQTVAQGKVVIRIDANSEAPVIPKEKHPLKLDPNATYVLVGGLGGLGRSVAGLMAKNGARNLAFFSRSGATSEEQVNFLHGLELQGVQARTYSCDICDRDSLATAIQKCTREMTGIRGVIQGAAVIKV
jgi:hypothetical protein